MKHLSTFIVLSVFSIQSILLAGEARRSTAVEGAINPESGNPVSVFLPNIAARDAVHTKRKEQRIEADKRGRLLEEMERSEEILEGLKGSSHATQMLALHAICTQLKNSFSMMGRISVKANSAEYLTSLEARPFAKVFRRVRADQSPISNFIDLCRDINLISKSSITGALATATKAIQLTIDNLNTISANEEKKDGKSENKQDENRKSRARSYFRDLFSE